MTSNADKQFTALVNAELRPNDYGDMDFSELYDHPYDWLDELRSIKIELDFQLSAARLNAASLRAKRDADLLTSADYADAVVADNKIKMRVLRVRAGVEQRMITVKALLDEDAEDAA